MEKISTVGVTTSGVATRPHLLRHLRSVPDETSRLGVIVGRLEHISYLTNRLSNEFLARCRLGNDQDFISNIARCHFPGTPHVAELTPRVELNGTCGYKIVRIGFCDDVATGPQFNCRRIRLEVAENQTSLVRVERGYPGLLRFVVKQTLATVQEYRVHLSHVQARAVNCTQDSDEVFGSITTTMQDLLEYLQIYVRFTDGGDTNGHLNEKPLPDFRQERARGNDYDYMVVRDFKKAVDYILEMYAHINNIIPQTRQRNRPRTTHRHI
ncbi:uncharacterized protein LOC135496193 [Lineus longissimus]|uniref:uncharacterized protein LOC135496193 n=1 Tax=Lineus longissimus TaxID=88925 RepID=UPI002B4E2913